MQKTTQFKNNLTWSFGNHSVKVGAGINFIDDIRRTNSFTRYTFASIAAYAAARSGAAPLGYTRFDQVFGNTNVVFDSAYSNFFIQDDWKVTRKLKLNYGVRYDYYRIPNADSTSPYVPSQKFKLDKNNFAPRLGFVYSVRDGDRPTVIRGSAGFYYDTVYSDMYLRALQANGSPTFFTVSFTNSALPTAPAFPNNVSTGAAPLQDITSLSTDFENMYAIHFNTQVEQVIANDLSVTVGFIHSGGRHIPVYRSINRIATANSLADGRRIFNTGAAAVGTRVDPRFNNILLLESGASSNYNALTFQLQKRFAQGYQFSANYTLSKSEDDAPEQNLVATQVGNLVVQDPNNRRRDFGPSLADQRHTFVMSFVGRPNFNFASKGLNYLLNNNQLGIIATANSGERFNIVASTDINGDGFTGSDNPVGIGRNSGTTPRQFNVDLRYSRMFPFSERFKLEFFAEAVNIFNINSVFQINTLTVTTDAAGNATQALPTVLNRPVTSLDSRQAQLGFKFTF